MDLKEKVVLEEINKVKGLINKTCKMQEGIEFPSHDSSHMDIPTPSHNDGPQGDDEPVSSPEISAPNNEHIDIDITTKIRQLAQGKMAEINDTQDKTYQILQNIVRVCEKVDKPDMPTGPETQK